MTLTDRTRRNWCLQETELTMAVKTHLATQVLRVPTHPLAVSVDFRDAILDGANDRESLSHRLDGLVALTNAVLTSDPAYLSVAIRKFDHEIREGSATAEPPKPDVVESVWTACGFRQDGGLLTERMWSAGTFLVFDWLRDLYCPSQPVIAEMTPVLAVYHTGSAVLNLLVERYDDEGGAGVIIPDLWSLGLVEFSRAYGKGPTFLQIMQNALRAGGTEHRLRWRLTYRSGTLVPTTFEGHSVEASAACCALAVAERNRTDEPPLLDPSVAITATCEGTKIGRVWEKGFNQKVALAEEVRLSALLHSRDQQVPSGRGIALQPVDTLSEAFDGLKVTSRTVAAFKKKIHEDWCQKHEMQPTGILWWGC